MSPFPSQPQISRGTGHSVLCPWCQSSKCTECCMRFSKSAEALNGDPLLTLARPAVGHHGIALLWACTLVAPWYVDTAEGTKDASTLSTLVDVCQREVYSVTLPKAGPSHSQPCELRGPSYRGQQGSERGRDLPKATQQKEDSHSSASPWGCYTHTTS